MTSYDNLRFSPPAPVVMVTLSHPDRQQSLHDVPMLIDSGADVTLLPRSASERLGIAGTGERYALEGFDGSTSESEVVRAVLVFLGRTFRGNFLLTDAEIGVLGRNLLNRVRLVLDGPALAWGEDKAERV